MSRHWAYRRPVCALALRGTPGADGLSAVQLRHHCPGRCADSVDRPSRRDPQLPALAQKPAPATRSAVGDANTRLMPPGRKRRVLRPSLGTGPIWSSPRGTASTSTSTGAAPAARLTIAYDDPNAEPYYDYYHDAVQGFVDRDPHRVRPGVDARHPRPIHVRGHRPPGHERTVFRRRTCTREFGGAALNGPNSIFGTLDALGYLVDPDLSVPYERSSRERKLRWCRIPSRRTGATTPPAST